MKALLLAAAALAAPLATAPAAAETVAITNATLGLGDGSAPIERGTVVIRDGRIAAAGRGVAVPAGARVVDGTGKWVVPGFVAGFSRVGLAEVDAVDETNDTSARKSPFSAALDVAPAINPRAAAIAVSRGRGVTRAVVAPESSHAIFGGQGAVIDMGVDADPITRAQAFQYVELGEQGAEEAGGSRPAAYAWFRNALMEARDYARSPQAYQGGRSRDALLMKLDAAALVPVVEGREPLLVHVERAADIRAVLALRREFPALKLVLVGASEGWTIAPEIRAAGVPVIAAALKDLPAAFETLAATQSNIGRMTAAGVPVAIGMINEDETRMVRNSNQLAGNLVALGRLPGATGLSWGQALAAITSKPAAAVGLAGQIGQLGAGARADVVLWDGDPLELQSAPVAMWIDGVQQPLESRQTRLRDRYRSLDPQALPKAYDR